MKTLAALFALCSVSSLIQAQASKQPARQAVTKDASALPPAPYVTPRSGTKYVYTGFSNTITRSEGWRVWYRDHRGAAGARIAHFIPDDPANPLVIADSSLRKLWPLQVGKVTDVIARRGEVRFLWRFTVVETEMVSTALGRHLAYRVDAVQQTAATPDPANAVVNIYSWWYAPAVQAVIRVNFLQATGARRGAVMKNQIVSIERDTTVSSR
jgi:hypothetical protein